MTFSELHHMAGTPAAAGMRHAPAPAIDPAPSELARLVNSVILPGFVGTTVPQWLARALHNGLAGVVYFTHNIDPETPGQVAALSAAIRAANPAAIIAVDEEGGNVTRLQARDGSAIPGAAVLGALNEPAMTEAAGRALGQLCRDAGINVTIAPVADVNTNPRNPVIGVRAFAADTGVVSVHTAAAVAGIQQLRVAACAKHFPGHGDTVADSHMEAARVELTLEQMRQFHLPPFMAAITAGVAAVMSAHIIVPEWGDLPATLNPAAARLLRDLGFDGVLITDALDMAAIRATVGPGEGGVLALLAGNDLLCVGNPLNAYTTGRDDEACYTEVFDAVHAAVLSGRLPADVLRRAAARVQGLARWSAQLPSEPGSGSQSQSQKNAVDWVDVAARACRVDLPGNTAVLAGSGPVTLVDVRTGHNMAAGPTENFLAAALSHYAVTVIDAAGLSPAELKAALLQSPSPVLVLTDSLDSPAQQDALEPVFSIATPAVCINAGLAPAHPATCHTIHCHGFSKVTAQAVVSLLESA